MYAILRVLFGWHQAPGLVLHVIATLLQHVDKEAVIVIQSLDNILCVSHDHTRLLTVTQTIVNTLQQAGFLIGPKSVLTPVQRTGWMGKDIDLCGPHIAPQPPALADLVTRWIRLALFPYSSKPLRRLLGRLGWLGRPGNLAGYFLAGARMWLNRGPRWAPSTPPSVIRGILEAMAMGA